MGSNPSALDVAAAIPTSKSTFMTSQSSEAAAAVLLMLA
jgi:hypothetical protein